MENQSTKYGNVQKCPQCGAPVEPMAVKCSTCGYEFRNVEALKSAQQLAAKLEEIENAYRDKGMGFMGSADLRKLQETATAIKVFAIPTAKEDLLDFAISMQSRWNTEEVDYLRKAFKAKYDECINKAKILFPNDPMFQGLFDQHNKDNKKISPKTKMLIIIGLVMLLMLAMIIGLGFAFK